MSASCSPAPVPDALTAYLRAVVEVIDASEAATAAQGRPNANAAYDRLQSANEAMHRALVEVMKRRDSLVATAKWREAVPIAERLRDECRAIKRVEVVPDAVRAMYQEKDIAAVTESNAFVAMRRDALGERL